ncbi:MAG: PEP-CTERM sorting domain-containing protein [Rhodocyclaceae bacterium]|nr:PEP-CTERM sorting domain-containing protein [Rhodocyclaceae bacterium]MBX3669594.1 PEP-CTERM sorting domain-containing protein [Rhodocyclaceae bacterium]
MATAGLRIAKLTIALASAAFASSSGMAAPIDILLGSDYFFTVEASVAAVIPLESRPGGLNGVRPQFAPLPGYVDTIVERRADCGVELGQSCQIPIELVGLSLQSVGGGFLIREDPDRASTGQMTIHYLTQTGPIAGGTFDSFFDVFFEISLDGGATWTDNEVANGPFPGVPPLQLGSVGSSWSSDPTGITLFVGQVGDQAANWHDPKSIDQFDFFPGTGPAGFQTIVESHPDGSIHRVVPIPPPVPVPPTVLLLGAGLSALGWMSRRRQSHV